MSEISKKQLEANCQNAKLGGVKTEEGKEISKYNALKHGILKQALTEYEEDLYQDFFRELEEQLSPTGFIEIMFVERIALCYVRLFRIAKVEKEYMISRLSFPPSSNLLANFLEEGIEGSYIPKIGINTLEKLNDIVLRYDTSIERSLFRLLKELRSIQALRTSKENDIQKN